MASTLGSSELARLAGVSTDTLRHYETKGLLAAPRRTSSGYRRYPPESVDRVRLIRRALVIGFTLDELARMLAERQRGGAPCRSVRALVGARLNDLEQRLRDLTALRDELTALVDEWDARLSSTAAGARAHLLDDLHAKPALDEHHTSARPALGQNQPRTPRRQW
jgi:DNA-binding transcriptional MerR regulator